MQSLILKLRDKIARERPEALEGLKVKDVISRQVVSLDVDEEVDKALEKISQYPYTVFPVVDHRNFPVGCITLKELVDTTRRRPIDRRNITVGLLALTTPVILEEEAPLREAIDLIAEKGETHLCVVKSIEEPILVGVLTEKDVFKALVRIMHSA